MKDSCCFLLIRQVAIVCHTTYRAVLKRMTVCKIWSFTEYRSIKREKNLFFLPDVCNILPHRLRSLFSLREATLVRGPDIEKTYLKFLTLCQDEFAFFLYLFTACICVLYVFSGQYESSISDVYFFFYKPNTIISNTFFSFLVRSHIMKKISTFTEFYRRHILYRKNVFDLNIYPMPVHHDEGWRIWRIDPPVFKKFSPEQRNEKLRFNFFTKKSVSQGVSWVVK